MSVFVVVWHMGGGGRSLIFSKNEYMEHVFTVSDFINFHLLLLAVPTFIFISIFLYASKASGTSGLKRRFSRIIILLCFWPIAHYLYKVGYQGLIYLAPRSPAEVIFMVLRAGHTIYYFFTSLLICLVISHLFLRLNRNVQLAIFLTSIIFLSFLPQITKITGYFELSAHWNPYNFVPLSLAAVLLAQNKDYVLKHKKIFLLISSLLGVAFAVIEWRYCVGEIFFPGQGYAIPAYTRLSLLFAVFAIFIVALNPRIKSNRLINHMSKYSLALYCLHPFLIRPVKDLLNVFKANEALPSYVSIFLVVVFSYGMAMVLKKFFLKEELIV